MALIATIAVAGAAVMAYLYLLPGRVDIYVADPPSPVAVYITFSSVALHRLGSSGSGWIVVFNGSSTVKLSSTPQLLASVSAPPGEYDEVSFTISSATVQIGGMNVTARIPSGEFKVHIIGGLKLRGGSTEKLLISLPHITLADGQIVISPSITARVMP